MKEIKMAQVLVTIPDAFAPRILAAFCKNYGYQATIINPESGEPQANPETIFQFVVRQRIKFLKDNVKQAEVPDLAKADRATRISDIDAVNITIEQVV